MLIIVDITINMLFIPREEMHYFGTLMFLAPSTLISIPEGPRYI